MHASIKNYILGLPLQFGAVRDAQGHASIIGPWREQSLIFDTALASKPVMQLAGEALGGVEWTPEESKQLYERARAWWENDREVLATAKKGDTFGSFGSGPILNTLRMVETFLARAILPQMEWAGEEQWQQLMGWLRELRELGVFPTIALPYVLIKRPSEAAAITEIIAADLKSDIDDAVTAAAKATRHWVLLSDIGGFPAPSPSLMATLIERVIFRRKPGIVSCLREMTYLIIEKPEAISPSQIGLLSASLMPWHHATILPMPDEQTGDFHEAERPELRVFLARLAGALDVWNGKITPLVPAPDNLAFWRDMCAGDPLPEIRRAFNAWNQPEP